METTDRLMCSGTVPRVSMAHLGRVMEQEKERVVAVPCPSPLTAAAHRRAFEAGAETDPDALLSLFRPDELLALVYPPLLATEAALHYAGRTADLCAALRLPLRRECRELREVVRSYRRHMMADLRSDVFELLKSHFDLFLGHCGGDVQTLWFTVNQALKTRYPRLSRYNVATEVLVTQALADYAVRCDTAAARTLSDRTGRTLGGVNYAAAALARITSTMARGLSVDGAPMVEMAVRVIDNKMKEMEFLMKNE